MSLKKFFSKYSFVPAFAVLASNLISSFVTRFFIGSTHDITTSLDKALPFIPEFIYIYVLAFVQWTACLIAVMIADKEVSIRYGFGMAAGNIIAGIVFVLFPTVMSIRPEFSGGGALTEMLGKFIFAADTPPMNIFPSVHCLSSWGCMRMIIALKKAPTGIKVGNAVFSVLVFLSVLFVKQHLIFDIPAGIIAFEAGLLTVKVLRWKKHD